MEFLPAPGPGRKSAKQTAYETRSGPIVPTFCRPCLPAGAVPRSSTARLAPVPLFCVSLRHWDRNVSLLKCRDLIFLGGSRISFMRCPVVQMKVQRLWRFAHQNPLSCQGYARCRGCAHISNENSLPDCCSSGALNIIHIKH